jgi:membrane protein YdbS with pleckstrin-like domain
MSTDQPEYVVDREGTARYFFWMHLILILAAGIWIMGMGLIVALLYAVTWGKTLPRRQADALRYWLEGSTLRADSGVFFLKRKVIPLDRITDLVLVQGPLLRWCGIWALQVQTAGSGQGIPEAVLYGLDRPEEIRAELLHARDKAVQRAAADG